MTANSYRLGVILPPLHLALDRGPTDTAKEFLPLTVENYIYRNGDAIDISITSREQSDTYINVQNCESFPCFDHLALLADFHGNGMQYNPSPSATTTNAG
jgi:hypothetical protein